MPFRLSNSCPTKYSSIEQQKLHEYQYKKFLKTLPINHSSKSKLFAQRQISLNNNYFTQRQIQLQYRHDQRKHEDERIQKENLKFSQRLINAKAFLNRDEQQAFFDKHCQLKQRLQHYPDTIRNQTKKSDFLLRSKAHSKTMDKPTDSSFLIYNDKSISQKKLPRLVKHNPMLSSIKSNIHLLSKTTEVSKVQFKSSLPPSSNIIHWNALTSTQNSQPSKSNLSSHSSSSSSEFFI